MSIKILVIGSPVGQLEAIFAKVGPLHAKNQFAFALVTGDLFGPPGSSDEDAINRLISGQVPVPLTTYFSLGKFALPQAIQAKVETTEGEVCENLFFLGRAGLTKTSDGVRIAALGGVSIDAENLDEYAPLNTMLDLEKLKGSEGVHLLLTNEWPEGILRGAKSPTEAVTTFSSVTAQASALVKPLYHLASSESQFYERQPFFQVTEKDADPSITRFISLAQYGTAGQKALYAFQLPLDGKLSVIPEDTTPSPFIVPKGRAPLPSQNTSFKRQYDTGEDWKRNGRNDRHGKRRKRETKQDECFFCLSFKALEKHLIVSIGDESYLAEAKGPLPTKDTFPELDASAHILIIPHSHAPTLASIADPSTKAATIAEMTRYLEALAKLNSSRGLGTVCWRLERPNLVHAHWQVMPLPSSLDTALLREAFIVEGSNDGFQVSEVPVDEWPERAVTAGEDPMDEDARASQSCEYFSVLIIPPDEDGKGRIHLKLPLTYESRFDVQFGRRVLAKMLSLDERTHWKDCGSSFEEEIADVEAFKKAFKEFDFSLE